MIKYRVDIASPSIMLDIMGRKKVFIRNEEVFEDTYTKTYPQHFKRLGEVTGYMHNLAKPMFIPDPIEEFLMKEEDRKTEKQKNEELEEVALEEVFNEELTPENMTEEDLEEN